MSSYEYQVRIDALDAHPYTQVMAGSFVGAAVLFVDKYFENPWGLQRGHTIHLLIKSTDCPLEQHSDGNPLTYKEYKVSLKLVAERVKTDRRG